MGADAIADAILDHEPDSAQAVILTRPKMVKIGLDNESRLPKTALYECQRPRQRVQKVAILASSKIPPRSAGRHSNVDIRFDKLTLDMSQLGIRHGASRHYW